MAWLFRGYLLHLAPSCLLAGACFVRPAWAGDVEVTDNGREVYVVRENKVVGNTPLMLEGIDQGEVDLVFRDAPHGPNLTSLRVRVPADGSTYVRVDAQVGRAVQLEKPPPMEPIDLPAPKIENGQLTVTVTDPKAEIWVDGVSTGARGTAVLREVAAGNHVIEARTPCSRASSPVSIESGRSKKVQLKPVAGLGEINVSGGPANAQVWVDGVMVGSSPTRLVNQKCGAHTVELRAPGYTPTQASVDVVAFESSVVQLNPTPDRSATLQVTVTPAMARIRLDGVDIGVGPELRTTAIAGPHVVEAAASGFRVESRTLDLVANETTALSLTLAPTSPAVAPSALPPKQAPSATNGDGRSRRQAVVCATLAGVGASSAVAALVFHGKAEDANADYVKIYDETLAQSIYDDYVAPNRKRTWVFGGVGAASLGASAVLWYGFEF
jgi:hypothetical protein